MRARRFFPSRTTGRALLGGPFDGSADKRQQNEFAMKPHTQRRKKRGQNDLTNNTYSERGDAAEAFSFALLKDQQIAK